MYLQEAGKQIVLTLRAAGYEAYYAGGWVRDLIMREDDPEHPLPDDIDIATDAPPEKIMQLFPHTIPVGLAFGIVIVILQGQQFEVATFRKDLEYLNGRSPEGYQLAAPQEDAKRRDFTINGMFYDPIENKIHDFVEGISDLKLKIIRTIGDPQERFAEDRLRMIRAIRFATRFDFKIDPETEKAIAQNASTLFPAVSIERVWQEFYKMAKYRTMGPAILLLYRTGLLTQIFPELDSLGEDTLINYIQSFPQFPLNTPTIAYIIELFPHKTREEIEELCRYFKTSTQEIRLAQFLCQTRQLLIHQNDLTPSPELVEWAQFYAHPDSELAMQIEAAKRPLEAKSYLLQHQKRQEILAPQIKRLKDKVPLVNASRLKAEGIQEGKRLGLLLKEAERIAINQTVENADAIIQQLKTSPLWP